MPQEVISIQHFGGMVTNPHKEDIPDNMAVYALNIDPQAELGVLKGIKKRGDAYQYGTNSEIPDVYEADWITYEVAGVPKWDLIYLDKSDALTLQDINAITDFYAVEASRGFSSLVSTGITPRFIKTFNNQAQIGNGVGNKANAVYRLLEDKNFFNDLETVTAGLQVENGECYNLPSDTDGSINSYNTYRSTGGSGYFQNGILYRYATSLVYGGLQESNLVEGAINNEAHTGSTIQVNLLAKGLTDITLLNSGVTAVKLYRAESSDDTIGNLGLYRLVKTIDINDGVGLNDVEGTANAAVTTTPTSLTDTRLDMEINAYIGNFVVCDGKVLFITSNTADTFNGDSWVLSQPASGLEWELQLKYTWGVSSLDYFMPYIDDGSYESGATYEEETGMPETLEFQSIRYALDEVGGGYHWVADGEPEGESDSDWQRYLYRSKKFRPNMFDWARDFLVLPEIPKALAWYNDRLYAFSDNTVYRINPELMYIEDTFFGAGASHRQSVLVSEYGMYFCNRNGAYRVKDSGIEVISDTIAETPTTGSYIGWKLFAGQSLDSAFDRVTIKAEVDKRLILFIGSTSGSTLWSLGFYIPTGQWYAYGIGAGSVNANSGAYGGKDGEIYLSNATASYRLFASTDFENTVWVSKEFHLNEPSQNKSWNKIKWDATTPGGSSLAVLYALTDGVDPATSATNDAYINIYKKTFQVKISGTAATINNPKMDSLDIIVRRLFGKR